MEKTITTYFNTIEAAERYLNYLYTKYEYATCIYIPNNLSGSGFYIFKAK